MTEEEKKAYDNLLMLQYFTMEKEDKESIDIILKLIEKQDTEINNLNKVIEEQKKQIEAIRIYKKNMPKDTEIVVMSKSDWLRNENKINYVGKTYDLTSLLHDYKEAAIMLKDMSEKIKEIIDYINKE